MSISKRTCLAIAVGTFVAGFASGGRMSAPVANAQASNRVFELRTYTAAPGKLDALHKRFRDHTVKLLSKHGMSHVGYWAPTDAPLASFKSTCFICAETAADPITTASATT